VDGDGISASYDNCPEVYNPEQLDTLDDLDANGRGAACDTCPGSSNETQFLSNLNGEVEWALADYPNEPYDRANYATDGLFQQARATWLATFKPDGCDPLPVPLASLANRDNDTAALPAPALPSAPAGPFCYLGCDTVIRNEIKIDGRTTPLTPATGSSSATVGVRFCDCKFLPDGSTSSMYGRAACAQSQGTASCVYNPSLYSNTQSTNPWKKIRTPQFSNNAWGTGTTTSEWTFSGGPNADSNLLWDFRSLGVAVMTEFHDAPNSAVMKGQNVKGVLWTLMRQLSPPVAGISNADMAARSASLSSGDAAWYHSPKKPNLIYHTREPLFCPSCPQGFQHPYYARGYPDWRMTLENASIWMPRPDSRTVSHYDQVAAGTVRHVPASEPFHKLARDFLTGSSFVRAVGVEGENVTRVLTSTSLEALPNRGTYSSPSGGPPTATGRGYAFSATKQRLYVLGGVKGVSSPAPTNEGWVFDLTSGTGSWRQFAFPAGESVGTVLAMAYRWQDQSIYFLDKSGSSLRIRRWNAQRKLLTGVIQTLATFPTSWNAFSKVELVNSPDGGMLLVAWQGTGSQKTWVGRVSVDKTSEIALRSLTKSTVPIEMPPAAGPTGYVSVLRSGTAGSEPYAVTTTFTSMPPPAAADRPIISPH